jgi:hypothetical protein
MLIYLIIMTLIGTAIAGTVHFLSKPRHLRPGIKEWIISYRFFLWLLCGGIFAALSPGVLALATFFFSDAQKAISLLAIAGIISALVVWRRKKSEEED